MTMNSFGQIDRIAVESIIAVVRELVVPLCKIPRTMVLPTDPERRENVAEHSFTLALVACIFASSLTDRQLDIGRVAQYAILHDIVEVYAGDTSVWVSEDELQAKVARERDALQRIAGRFDAVFPWISEMIENYELRSEAEAKFVYALDKVVPHISILVAGRHPILPTREDYKDRVAIARRKIGEDADIQSLFDQLLDMFEQRPDFFADS